MYSNNDSDACTACAQYNRQGQAVQSVGFADENGGKNTCTAADRVYVPCTTSAIGKHSQGYQASSRKISNLVSRIL